MPDVLPWRYLERGVMELWSLDPDRRGVITDIAPVTIDLGALFADI